MENKQTAVEWLLNNLHEIGVNHNLSIKAEKGWLEKRNEIIKQAKDMEKEQIEDAFLAGGNSVFNFQRGNSFQTIENYTEQTYKSE